MDPTTVELIQRRAAEAAAARAAAATNSTSTRMPFGKEARGVNKSSKPSTARKVNKKSPPADRPAAPVRPKPNMDEEHAFGIHDMLHMPRVGAAVISPKTGSMALFTVRKWDEDSNSWESNIYLYEFGSGDVTALTSDGPGVSNSDPCWDPDETDYAYLSTRSGSTQIWSARFGSGAPQQLSEYEIPIENLQWSANGIWMFFSASIYLDAPTMAETAERDAARAADPVQATTYDRLMTRHWDHWLDHEKVSHVWAQATRCTPHSEGRKHGQPNTRYSLGGPLIDATAGWTRNCPVSPFGGAECFVPSPNSGFLAINVATYDGNSEMAWSTSNDILILQLDSSEVTNITADNPGTDSDPVWDPSGRYLAYLSMEEPGFEADRRRLKVYDMETGETRTLHPDWTRSPGSLAWSNDGSIIFGTVEEQARNIIFAMDFETGKPRPVYQNGTNQAIAVIPNANKRPALWYKKSGAQSVKVSSPKASSSGIPVTLPGMSGRLRRPVSVGSSASSSSSSSSSGVKVSRPSSGTATSPAFNDGTGDTLVFINHGLTSPHELFSIVDDGESARKAPHDLTTSPRLPTLRYTPNSLTRLTYFTADFVEKIKFGEPGELYFEGSGGDDVHSWVIKPVDFDESKKYPVAIIIHGGPQGAMTDDFHYRWNPQVYAGAGYVTVCINFHGSTGFGQDFVNAISGNWGGAPFEDIMLGTDAITEHLEFVDPSRIGILGASYGGYMMNWINGHTDRYAAIVTHDGMFDTFNSYFTTEELWFPEHEFEGKPWETADVYDKWNPRNHVQEWVTPTLVIHSALDYRLVDGIGLAVFTGLQRQSVPSKLLYFPDENHWVAKPLNSLRWHNEVLSWLDTWCDNE